MSDPIVLNAVDNDDGNLVFQLSNVDKSIANGLRRTILTNIPVVVFRTSPEEENNCIIDKNTTRFNNEIVKQRLSCIPICIADPEKSIDTLLLEVKKENHSSEIVYVTTEDFKIKETNTGKYLSESETKKIFPPNAQTKCFIDFLRLRPPLADDLKGEEISLTCRFSRSSAKESGMFNAACTCSYGGTQDVDKVLLEWDKIQAKMEKDGIPDDEVMNAKENWFLLDAKRYLIANSFDFIVGGIGIYDNRTLVRIACNVIMRQLTECGIPGYRARIRPIVSRITIHWPSFYNVVTGKTLALPNLIALQHIPLSPAGVIAKRPAPIALPNSCAAEWRMAPDAVFSPYASVRYFTPHMVHSQYNLL